MNFLFNIYPKTNTYKFEKINQLKRAVIEVNGYSCLSQTSPEKQIKLKKTLISQSHIKHTQINILQNLIYFRVKNMKSTRI